MNVTISRLLPNISISDSNLITDNKYGIHHAASNATLWRRLNVTCTFSRIVKAASFLRIHLTYSALFRLSASYPLPSIDQQRACSFRPRERPLSTFVSRVILCAVAHEKQLRMYRISVCFSLRPEYFLNRRVQVTHRTRAVWCYANANRPVVRATKATKSLAHKLFSATSA
jgi:hypothetical protein